MTKMKGCGDFIHVDYNSHNGKNYKMGSGDGIADTLGINKVKTAFQNIPKKIVGIKDKVVKKYDKVVDYGKTVLTGRDDVPPKVRDILKRKGDQPIVKIEINRIPVSPLLTGALNVVSQGQFNQKMSESPYDELYHLQLISTLEDGKRVLIEKNEVINSDINQPSKPKAELMTVPYSGGLTLNKLMDGARSVMGNKFIPYNAVSNNCQDFIMAVLQGSGIGNQQVFDFVKQYTKSFFKGAPVTKAVSKFATDAGAKLNEIMKGSGITDRSDVQSIIFERPKWTLKRAENWCKKHGKKHDVDVKPEHYRFRQVDPKKFDHYETQDIGKGIKLIIGFKNKSPRRVMKGSGHETELIKKMAELSHDIHAHRKIHGRHPAVVGAFKALGEGLKHTYDSDTDSESDTDDEDRMEGRSVKIFNKWSKAIGQKFLPLNKNLSPVKHAATSRASDYVTTTGDPMAQGKMALDMFQSEAPETKRALKGRGRKKLQPHNEIDGGSVKIFNKWSKAIGQKFLPLNKNLSPVKHAATERASDYVKTTGDPMAQGKMALDMFQEEAPQTTRALRGRKPKTPEATGSGVKPKKGSPEMKERMAKMRAMRGKK